MQKVLMCSYYSQLTTSLQRTHQHIILQWRTLTLTHTHRSRWSQVEVDTIECLFCPAIWLCWGEQSRKETGRKESGNKGVRQHQRKLVLLELWVCWSVWRRCWGISWKTQSVRMNIRKSFWYVQHSLFFLSELFFVSLWSFYTNFTIQEQ